MREVEIRPGLIVREDGMLKRTRHTSKYKDQWQLGSLNSYGYRVCGVGAKKVEQVSRLVVEAFIGPIPKNMFVDHINGDRQDNRVENLRIVTRRQNQQNLEKHRNGKLVGCSQDGTHWRCHILLEGVYHRWGWYTTEQEAHLAYLKKLAEFGEILAR
jgi:hypothetical protein